MYSLVIQSLDQGWGCPYACEEPRWETGARTTGRRLLVLVRGPGKIDATGREASAKGQLPFTNGGELAAHMSDRITEHTHKTTFLEKFEVRFRIFQAS